MANSHGVPAPGHRLPAGTHTGSVRLQVANLDRSIQYYERTIGVRVLQRTDGHARLGPHSGAETSLIELREVPGVVTVPPRGRLGLYHFAILVPDRASLGRFIRHLSSIGERAGSANHLVSESLYLRDPDGHGIEVYADRPRENWQWRGAELIMVADPLDTSKIIEAAGDTSWEGLPGGTVIGHVHLHVGDLDAAAHFYHVSLGFDKMSWSYPGALFLAAGGYHHHLGLNTWAPNERPLEGEAQLLEWELVLPTVEDVERARRAMEEAGYATTKVDAGWTVSDQWGTVVRCVFD